MRMLNVGYGNVVSVSRVIAIVSPEAAPIRRMIQDAKDTGKAIDATCGKKTRAVMIMDSGHIVLSPLQPDTLTARAESGKGKPSETKPED